MLQWLMVNANGLYSKREGGEEQEGGEEREKTKNLKK